LNALKAMNIARRKAGKNCVSIVRPGTNNNTGNGLKSFRIKIRANVAKSTDVKVGRRADVGNVTIKIEITGSPAGLCRVNGVCRSSAEA